MSKTVTSFSFSQAVVSSPTQRAEWLAFAGQTARKAGQVVLPHFRSQLMRGDTLIDNKLSGGSYDPVTVADREAEMAIRRAIEETYPSHGIYGEEYGHKAGNGLTWVIDPIDGTRAFMTGLLHWGILLALFDGENPILGVMYQPYTDELFVGDGTSAWLLRGEGKTPLTTSGRTELAQASMLTTTAEDFFQGAHRAAFRRLRSQVKMTKIGGDCYLFAMLAMGGVDLGIESGLQPYDIQALVPIIRGAGGVITCWDGGNPSMGGEVIASANTQLHRAALDRLAN